MKHFLAVVFVIGLGPGPGAALFQTTFRASLKDVDVSNTQATPEASLKMLKKSMTSKRDYGLTVSFQTGPPTAKVEWMQIPNGPQMQRSLLPQEKKVAAIVAIYQPHFKFALEFLSTWKECAAGRSAVDFLLVFSNQTDADLFGQQWRGTNSATPVPAVPLIAQQVPIGAKPQSWKKLDGLATVLQNYQSRYEFALMLDAEIALGNCQAFESLMPTLRQKHASKTWYGVRSSCIPGNMQNAARAIASSPQDVAVLRQATMQFAVNTWWNELPYVHIDAARQMFDLWSQRVQRKLGQEVGVLLAPTDVTRHLNAGAGAAFEHLEYQLYMVLHHNFTIKDLAPQMMSSSAVSTCYSLSEIFERLSEHEKGVYTSTVNPLWLPGCQGWKPNSYSANCVLRFHLDRPC